MGNSLVLGHHELDDTVARFEATKVSTEHGDLFSSRGVRRAPNLDFYLPPRPSSQARVGNFGASACGSPS